MQEPGQFPGPLKELDFWNERAVNLSSIHQQLSSDRIRKVVKVLELAKSTYYPAFNRCALRTAAVTAEHLHPLCHFLPDVGVCSRGQQAARSVIKLELLHLQHDVARCACLLQVARRALAAGSRQVSTLMSLLCMS